MAVTFADEVQLARALVQAPSPSGHEAPATAVLREALEGLGYDDATTDAAGNAVGVLRRGDGPTLLLCGHLDTVPTGDAALWPHPPLSGEIVDGRLWGRGACDMKGGLACMALAGRDAADAGFRGTLILAGVVQEEVGGLGARYLAGWGRADLVLLGEPSNMALMHGHRGRVEILVRLPGRMAHAARSELGENALYRAATLLRRLEGLELPRGGPLGASTLAPTQLVSFPRDGANVVPGRAELTVDYRNIPGDEPEAILARLGALDPQARLEIPLEQARSEDGQLQRELPRIVPPYLAPADHPLVERVRGALGQVLADAGRAPEQGHWWFCTDAPHLAALAPVVGFGPGDPELAHTTDEHVPVSELALARRAYCAVALELLR